MSKPAVIFVLLQTGAAANGGIESISQVILRLREFRPVVVTNLQSAAVERLCRAGVEVHVVAEDVSAGVTKAPLRYASTYLRYFRKLKQLLRSTGARVIHANDPLAFQLAVSAARTSPGVRIALNMRDTIDPARRPPHGRYAAYFRLADRLIFLSQDMADGFAALAGRPPRACSVTYSIVDFDRFAQRPMSVDGPRPVVLVPGVVSAKKGHQWFLREVAPALVAAGAEIRIAGDFDPNRDAYSKACAQAAAALGDAVQFLGYRGDLPELMAQARVVATPSAHEGLMRGMIEAMSVGRPVVSTQVCSAREMLEDLSGGAGQVVPIGAAEDMARAILHYCTDPQAAEAAGNKGAATARRLFDPDTVIARYEDAYRAMLADEP